MINIQHRHPRQRLQLARHIHPPLFGRVQHYRQVATPQLLVARRPQPGVPNQVAHPPRNRPLRQDRARRLAQFRQRQPQRPNRRHAVRVRRNVPDQRNPGCPPDGGTQLDRHGPGRPAGTINRLHHATFGTNQPTTNVHFTTSKPAPPPPETASLAEPPGRCNRAFSLPDLSGGTPTSSRRPAQKMKSVDRNFECRSVTIREMISSLPPPVFAATRLRIEKTRSASVIDSVPSAESFRPVNGNVSGPR